GLPQGRLLRGFPGVHMAGGLVDHVLAGVALPHPQELAVAVDDGGHGEVTLVWHQRSLPGGRRGLARWAPGGLRAGAPLSLDGAISSTANSPGARSSRDQSPMRTRTRRRVGRPTAAVMRRTWRLRPSRMVSSSQAVGTVL